MIYHLTDNSKRFGLAWYLWDGDWSVEMHQLIADRVVKILENNGTVAMSLLSLLRGGYTSINSWLVEYGHAPIGGN